MIWLLLESLMEIQCSDNPSKFPVTPRLHYVCFYMESIQEIIISAVTKLIVAVHLFFFKPLQHSIMKRDDKGGDIQLTTIYDSC